MRLNERIQGDKAKLIFNFIFKYRSLTKQQLKVKSGLTGTTLTRVLDDLIAQHVIISEQFAESTGGRRPLLYRINPRYGYVLGLDISRAYSRLVLCDFQMRNIASYRWEMDEKMTPARLIAEVVHEANEMLVRHRIAKDKVIGCGIGAVGPLDREQGLIINPHHFKAQGWENVPICEQITQQLGVSAIVDNGANTAILGEYWLEEDDRLEHLLYVHAGIGIRSAMIVGGKLVYGAVDMEGSVGQMIIQCDISDVQLAQHSGSWEALSKQSPTYFGVGLANLLNILHPQKVILGGPLIMNDELYYERAIHIAINHFSYAHPYDIAFEKSKLGDEGVAIGAAVMLMNEMGRIHHI